MSNFLENLHLRLVEEVKRVTPQVVAKHSGVARATLYNWMERGNVPMDKLALLEVAGVDVSYVLTGKRNAIAVPPALTADERELLALFRAAPLAVKAAAIGALQGGALGGRGAMAQHGNGIQIGQAGGPVHIGTPAPRTRKRG